MKYFIALLLVFMVGCQTAPVEKTVEVTKTVVKVPIKTITYIGVNGKKTVVNYYEDLEEYNKNNTSDDVILFKKNF